MGVQDNCPSSSYSLYEKVHIFPLKMTDVKIWGKAWEKWNNLSVNAWKVFVEGILEWQQKWPDSLQGQETQTTMQSQMVRYSVLQGMDTHNADPTSWRKGGYTHYSLPQKWGKQSIFEIFLSSVINENTIWYLAVDKLQLFSDIYVYGTTFP